MEDKSRGAAKASLVMFLSPLPGLRIHCATSHGWRRGLISVPKLFHRRRGDALRSPSSRR